MSCRIIGRKIELQILENFALNKNHIEVVKSRYIKTKKCVRFCFYKNKFKTNSFQVEINIR